MGQIKIQMANCRHFEKKTRNCCISAAVRPIATEFGTMLMLMKF